MAEPPIFARPGRISAESGASQGSAAPSRDAPAVQAEHVHVAVAVGTDRAAVGLTGLPDAIGLVWPTAVVQLCLVP
jgi:hypothetical protein